MRNANKARRLAESQKIAVLSTRSLRQKGYPFGSLAAYALDDRARPLLLLSGLAVHTRNLREDARASLTIFDDDAFDRVMTASRLTIMGELSQVAKADVETLMPMYLTRHEDARQWAGFKDFALFRMAIKDLYFVEGFGSMGWILPQDFETAGRTEGNT